MIIERLKKQKLGARIFKLNSTKLLWFGRKIPYAIDRASSRIAFRQISAPGEGAIKMRRGTGSSTMLLVLLLVRERLSRHSKTKMNAAALPSYR